MKPMEQLFLYDLTRTKLLYPRTLWCVTDYNISNLTAREDRMRMSLEDKTWFQFHGDLEIICLHAREDIHNNMYDLVMLMEVPYKRLSPHPEAIDMDSQNSIS